MIKINNVSFKYKKGLKVLNNINLNVNEGEFISIIGKNGSGKSTLAKLIAGLLKPTTGNIEIDNFNTSENRNFIDIRKKIGIVFQNPENQIIFNNVYDDIAFALKNLKLEDIDLRVNEALRKVKMEEYLQEGTYELSLGQKQRITIAGVLSINPRYIIFDEPTTMLDSQGKEDVYDIILELKQQGYTIIYITNVVDEILMSDRIIVLESGEIVENFNKQNIMKYTDILSQRGIKLPKIIQILEKMKDEGIDISLEKWNFGELTEELVKAIKTKNN